MENPDLSLEDFYTYDPQQMTIGVTTERTSESGVIEYKIELQFGQVEYICFRRYNQFREFDSILKSAFPRLALPVFPSKFTMVNKKEQRKRVFHTYLNGILVMCAKFPPMAKSTLMNLVGEFLEISGKEKKNEEKTRSSKDAIIESAQIGRNSGHFTGPIDVIIGEED